MITASLKKIYGHFQHDTLFRNSIYLMAATGVLAGFGFFFWLINARLFDAEKIGLATTLISTMNLIALLSLIGFDNVLVRFLPHSKQKNDHINTALVLVGIVAAVLALGFVVFLPVLSPKLLFIREQPYGSVAFVFFSVTAAWNVLTDAIFLAYRRTVFTLGINVLFSFTKMLLPFAFVGFGAVGTFLAAGIASFIGFVLSIAAMMKYFGYRPQLAINKTVLREVKQYTGANYVAGLANLLPPTLLPIIITNKLGAASAAYFYIALMIANLLYVISLATSKSLFAEGSHGDGYTRTELRRATKVISMLSIPAIVVLMILTPFILSIFGPDYREGGTALLRIMALAGLAVAGYTVMNTLFRVTKQLRPLVINNVVYAGVILGVSFVVANKWGLPGIGWAWLAGHAIAWLTGSFWLLSRRKA